MELLLPDPGLFFWTLIIVLAIFLLLKKFAWGPILNALKEREESIDNAIKSADNARKEMAKLQSDNEKLLAEARIERDKILKEANEIKTSLIEEAKKTAQSEGNRMIEEAKEAIKRERNAALSELKNQVATLSIEIAEKVLNKKFENAAEQEAVVKENLGKIQL